MVSNIYFTIVANVVSVQFNSVAQSCPTLCDLMDCCAPGLPVRHQLPESTQTHVYRVSDAIQPSHPLLLSPQHLIALLLTRGNNIFFFFFLHSVQFSSVARSCSTLCDPMDCSTSGIPVHHQFTEFTKNSCPLSW